MLQRLSATALNHARHSVVQVCRACSVAPLQPGTPQNLVSSDVTTSTTTDKPSTPSSGQPEQQLNHSISNVEWLCADLVCPLSKAPLRLDPVTSELVCDEINVAYPVIEGIPRLLPSMGRILGQ